LRGSAGRGEDTGEWHTVGFKSQPPVCPNVGIRIRLGLARYGMARFGSLRPWHGAPSSGLERA
jgi:hypothetical protein